MFDDRILQRTFGRCKLILRTNDILYDFKFIIHNVFICGNTGSIDVY